MTTLKKHGTTGYSKGCRCRICKDAVNAYQTARRHKNKPAKLIETELGTEKMCSRCGEYYPLEPEFFFFRPWVNKDGVTVSVSMSPAKCCYHEKRKLKNKRHHQIKSSYEVAA